MSMLDTCGCVYVGEYMVVEDTHSDTCGWSVCLWRTLIRTRVLGVVPSTSTTPLPTPKQMVGVMKLSVDINVGVGVCVGLDFDEHRTVDGVEEL